VRLSPLQYTDVFVDGIRCRALKDSGAQLSLISQAVCDQLKPEVYGHILLQGVVGDPIRAHLVNVCIKPCSEPDSVNMAEGIQVLCGVAPLVAVNHDVLLTTDVIEGLKNLPVVSACDDASCSNAMNGCDDDYKAVVDVNDIDVNVECCDSDASADDEDVVSERVHNFDIVPSECMNDDDGSIAEQTDPAWLTSCWKECNKCCRWVVDGCRRWLILCIFMALLTRAVCDTLLGLVRNVSTPSRVVGNHSDNRLNFSGQLPSELELMKYIDCSSELSSVEQPCQLLQSIDSSAFCFSDVPDLCTVAEHPLRNIEHSTRGVAVNLIPVRIRQHSTTSTSRCASTRTKAKAGWHMDHDGTIICLIMLPCLLTVLLMCCTVEWINLNTMFAVFIEPNLECADFSGSLRFILCTCTECKCR